MTLDLRLAVPAVVAWTCAGVVIGFPEAVAATSGTLWAASIAVVAIRLSGRGGAVLGAVSLSLIAAAAMATCILVELPGRTPEPLATAAASHRRVALTLSVDSAPHAVRSQFAESTSGRETFRATIVGVAAPPASSSASPAAAPSGNESRTRVRVRATVLIPAVRAGQLEIGDRVALSATVSASDAGRKESFLVVASEPPKRLAPPPWWLAWADGLRRGFADLCGRLPGDGGSLLPGLAIGETSAVPDTLDAAMKRSSLSHVTAVSGSNCSVMVALILLGSRALGLGRRSRAVVSLSALAAFVVLVTPDPSVVRAAAMGAILIVSALGGRRSPGLPLLAAAVLCILFHDPWIAREYGLVLSAIATAGLMVLAPPLAAKLGTWMPQPLAAVVAIPLAAQLACQPVLVLLSPVVPLYGVPANLLAEPAAPLAAVLGLIACVAAPLSAGAAYAIAQAAWLPAAWIAAIARTVEALPGSSLPWLQGGAGFAIAAIAAGAGAALILTRARHGGGLRAACAAILCVVVVGLAGTLGGGRASNSLRASGEWAIMACDIGQGDAFVVRSAGSFALVDTGPKPAALTACLERLGIERIDLLILTHYDLDHVGGTAAVVGRVGTALVGPSEGGRDVRLADDLGRGGATVRQAGRGDHGRLGNLTWRILWPRTDSTLMQTGNEGSVTVAFDGDGITSLFLGDLGRDSQNAMMAANTLGEFDVVKVAHHGSADQSEALYQRVHARLGLISVGVGNPYGHPRDSLLGILERAGTKAARTDREGMIMVSVDRSSPGTLRVWSERPDTSPRESVGARG